MNQPRKLDILCDYDDTVANFTALWAQAHNALFPEKTALTHLDINRYDLKAIGELTSPELEETFRWVRSQNYNLTMLPVDKNFEYWFTRLLRDGHRIRILTANPPEVAPKIAKWLANYGIPGIEVISVPKSEDKLKYDFDILIDDAPMLIEKMKGDKRHLITYAALHNKKFNRQAKRLAMNWRDVYEHVTQIAQEESASASATSSLTA